MPLELLEHFYRKKFHLSYRQMLDEPADAVILAMAIEKLLSERKQDEIKAAERKHGH